VCVKFCKKGFGLPGYVEELSIAAGGSPSRLGVVAAVGNSGLSL